MKRALFIFLALIIAVPVIRVGVEFIDDSGSGEVRTPPADVSAQIANGNYLTLPGDCMACHTVRGGKPYAGGRAIPTPFGNIISPNITPDVVTGIGSWTSDDFWRALHNGRSKDGRFLYPAFPYPNYTQVTRTDSDAIFAYLKTLAPIEQPNREHELRFPYNQRILLAVWRALYFRAGVYRRDPTQTAEWNRGAYLVQGLGHCDACHSNRNALGATEHKADLAGAVIPILNWYAPALTSDAEAGLGDWGAPDIVGLLKVGVAQHGTVYGPMAEVVRQSLQHLSESDVRAIAGYLKSLPQTGDSPQTPAARISGEQDDSLLKLGAEIYKKQCSDCHQATGEGIPPAYPPLAGNRSLTMEPAINPVRMVLNGGYPPSTSGNPRPFGMPPFRSVLNDEEIAAVVSYIRNSWGNRAGPVAAFQVSAYRAVPAD